MHGDQDKEEEVLLNSGRLTKHTVVMRVLNLEISLVSRVAKRE
jgi:hypothetical protein